MPLSENLYCCITPIGLTKIYSDKVHAIHKYNVKILGPDSKPVAYLDHLPIRMAVNPLHYQINANPGSNQEIYVQTLVKKISPEIFV